MATLWDKFPQIKSSRDAAAVPWENSVVWVVEEANGQRFDWIDTFDVEYVSWTNGNFSIRPHSESPLSHQVENIILQEKMIFVGKKVRVS
ncbi:MAG: hypothetical protein WC421_11155 [Elusimicrobiales bacterium]